MKSSTKTLDEIQNQFWTHLLAPDADPHSLGEIIEDSGELTAEKRMSIYSTAYSLRISGALAEDFKDLKRFMNFSGGEETFEKLVHDYLEVVISNHFSLRYMGARLPEYLENSVWNRRFPWAADLARFEWAKTDLFDGPDHGVATRDTLARVPQEKWPTLRFILTPNLTLLPTAYRVELLSETDEETTAIPDNFSAAAGTLKVWRKEEEIYYELISDAELKLLTLVKAGKEFGEICEAFLTDETQNPAGLVFEILSRWLGEHLIVEIF